jgi:hypothetical protein
MSAPLTIVDVIDGTTGAHVEITTREGVQRVPYDLFLGALERAGFEKASLYVGDLADAPEADVYIWNCDRLRRESRELTPAFLERTRKSLVASDPKRMSKEAERIQALGAIDIFSYGNWLDRQMFPDDYPSSEPEAHDLVGSLEIARQWGVENEVQRGSEVYTYMFNIPKPLPQLIFDYVTAELARRRAGVS